jgi:hypothetical protein
MTKTVLVCHSPEHEVYDFIKDYINKDTWYIDPYATSNHKNFIKKFINDEEILNIIPNGTIDRIIFVNCDYSIPFERKENNSIPSYPYTLDKKLFNILLKLLKKGGVVKFGSWYLAAYNLFGGNDVELIRCEKDEQYDIKLNGIKYWKFIQPELKQLMYNRFLFYRDNNYNPLKKIEYMYLWTNQLLEPYKDQFDITKYGYMFNKETDYPINCIPDFESNESYSIYVTALTLKKN